MFFVVSGYCRRGRTARCADRGSPGWFLFRRAMRIYPPFWAAVLLTVVVYALLRLRRLLRSTLFEEYLHEAWRAVGTGEWLGILTLTSAFRPSGELPWTSSGR